MNRRTLIGVAAAGAILPLLDRAAIAQTPPKITPPKTRNVVFVHGLFADGSCWSKVIARLQPRGINCTSVQNPLTSLAEASTAATDVESPAIIAIGEVARLHAVLAWYKGE